MLARVGFSGPWKGCHFLANFAFFNILLTLSFRIKSHPLALSSALNKDLSPSLHKTALHISEEVSCPCVDVALITQ